MRFSKIECASIVCKLAKVLLLSGISGIGLSAFNLLPANAQAIHGTCSTPEGRRNKYECQRGDGSIGWFIADLNGGGFPIFAVAGLDTANAQIKVKRTTAYPGYDCIYDEPRGVDNPSQRCIQSVRQAALRDKGSTFRANCQNRQIYFQRDGYLPGEPSDFYLYTTVRTSPGEPYLKSFWLPLGVSRPRPDDYGDDGTLDVITTAKSQPYYELIFRQLCPRAARGIGLSPSL